MQCRCVLGHGYLYCTRLMCDLEDSHEPAGTGATTPCRTRKIYRPTYIT